ncbi:hypothetical protein ACFWW0_27455, partial [Streptomyces violascens]
MAQPNVHHPSRCSETTTTSGSRTGNGHRGRPGRPIDSQNPFSRTWHQPLHLTQELPSQLDALSAHGIPRDKIFSEKVGTRSRVRLQFEAALTLAREIKAHAPHCRVLFTVYAMKRLGRGAAELTAPTTWLFMAWGGVVGGAAPPPRHPPPPA